MRRLVIVLSCGMMLSCAQRPSFKGHTRTQGNDTGKIGNNTTPPTTSPGSGMDTHKKQVDEFKQNQLGVLDILLVIDNSQSMAEEQANLANNLPALLQYVGDSDWQIAVISTTQYECLSKRITKHTVNFEEEYKKMVNLGMLGSGVELYFYQAVAGLKGECNNISTAWLRQNSTVAVVIVGDEANQCTLYIENDILPKGTLCTSSALTNYLNSIRPSGKSKAYGIVRMPGFDKHEQDALSGFTAYGDINDTSYSSTLQKISQSISNVMTSNFTLSQVPSSKVAVTVNGTTLASSQYTIDAQGKQLKFDQGYMPADNASIVASYSYVVE